MVVLIEECKFEQRVSDGNQLGGVTEGFRFLSLLPSCHVQGEEGRVNRSTPSSADPVGTATSLSQTYRTFTDKDILRYLNPPDANVGQWWDLKNCGWIPGQAKDAPRHEPRDGIIMCGNHRVQFDSYDFFIRFFPDVSLIRL